MGFSSLKSFIRSGLVSFFIGVVGGVLLAGETAARREAEYEVLRTFQEYLKREGFGFSFILKEMQGGESRGNYKGRVSAKGGGYRVELMTGGGKLEMAIQDFGTLGLTIIKDGKIEFKNVGREKLYGPLIEGQQWTLYDLWMGFVREDRGIVYLGSEVVKGRRCNVYSNEVEGHAVWKKVRFYLDEAFPCLLKVEYLDCKGLVVRKMQILSFRKQSDGSYFPGAIDIYDAIERKRTRLEIGSSSN